MCLPPQQSWMWGPGTHGGPALAVGMAQALPHCCMDLASSGFPTGLLLLLTKGVSQGPTLGVD